MTNVYTPDMNFDFLTFIPLTIDQSLRDRVAHGGGLSCVEAVYEICLEISRVEKHLHAVALAEAFEAADSFTPLPTRSLDLGWRREDYDRLSALLERILVDPSLKCCTSLWRFYVQNLVRCKKFEEAKRVYFRALQFCSWDKSFWMLALGELRRCFSEEELQDILRVIEEKRIHVRATGV